MDNRDLIESLVPSRLRRFLKDRTGIAALHSRVTALEERFETEIMALQRRIDQLEKRSHESSVALSDLELAHGSFDSIEQHDNKLTISGWLMLPEREFDSVALYVNESKVGESDITEKEYVAKTFPFISHAGNSGFSLSVDIPLEGMEENIDICVVGMAGGRELAKMETWYRKNLYSCLPVPPAHLLLRETANENPFQYLITGLQCYKEFWTAVCRHADPHSIKTILDWGCGCGRVIGFFEKFSGIARMCGCDVDAEAIAWCKENLKPIEFSAIPFSPPTSYPDQAFDLIISFSVLTHLSVEDQAGWLSEMRRILAPGGLFLATVHGEFAAVLRLPGRKASDNLKKGIYDDMDDHSLEGVAPEGYYRSVFQSKDYTVKEYSQYFDIVEYIERGALNFQDLVVMRKKI